MSGITPAHAGRILFPRPIFLHHRDHPRACGKNESVGHLFHFFEGSPPRMREELLGKVYTEHCMRITPAHAGRMTGVAEVCLIFMDHPRACGKNLSTLEALQLRLGSPPRMREEFSIPMPDVRTIGITPAHAGRIIFFRPRLFSSRDHPRACGKNYVSALTFCICAGSPPRMREELFLCWIMHTWIQDHPRACGKNFGIPCASTCIAGSPPRMREE